MVAEMVAGQPDGLNRAAALSGEEEENENAGQ